MVDAIRKKNTFVISTNVAAKAVTNAIHLAQIGEGEDWKYTIVASVMNAVEGVIVVLV